MLFWIPVETVCEFDMEFEMELPIVEMGDTLLIEFIEFIEFIELIEFIEFIEFIELMGFAEFRGVPAEFMWNRCFFAGMGRKLKTCFSYANKYLLYIFFSRNDADVSVGEKLSSPR